MALIINMDLGEEGKMEKRITNIITKIKKDRNRAGYQNICNFFNRSEPKMEMDSLKKLIEDLENREIIR